MNQEEVKESFVTLAPGTIGSDFALKNLSKALGEAQNEFLPAVKTEENKWGGYQYTPLVVIVSAVRPALTKHHLTVSQFSQVDLEQKIVSVFTRLVHWDSGEWMQNQFDLPGELALGKDGAPKFNQQTIGGSQTYGQKYPYKAILGIPDSEELIDSSDEKSNLPARQNKQQTRTTPAQAAQQTQPKPAAQKPAQEQHPEIVRKPFKIETSPEGKTTVICAVSKIDEGETKSKKPFLKVIINGYLRPAKAANAASENFAYCFDTALFAALKSAVDKECQVAVNLSGQYAQIEDVLMIDGQEYLDGAPFNPTTEEVPNA